MVTKISDFFKRLATVLTKQNAVEVNVIKISPVYQPTVQNILGQRGALRTRIAYYSQCPRCGRMLAKGWSERVAKQLVGKIITCECGCSGKLAIRPKEAQPNATAPVNAQIAADRRIEGDHAAVAG